MYWHDFLSFEINVILLLQLPKDFLNIFYHVKAWYLTHFQIKIMQIIYIKKRKKLLLTNSNFCETVYFPKMLLLNQYKMYIIYFFIL